MKNFEGIKAMALDFDGTIIESVGVKDKAFEDLFSDYTEHWPDIWNYHKRHDAIIRFDKFKYISESILKETYCPEREADWCARFQAGVIDGLVTCPYVPGAKEFLEEWSSKVPLYLLSMSPEEELAGILAARELNHYFKGVFAYPWKKSKALQAVIDTEKIHRESLIFIGDSPDDHFSAIEAKVRFVGRYSGKSFPDDVDCVGDLSELL